MMHLLILLTTALLMACNPVEIENQDSQKFFTEEGLLGYWESVTGGYYMINIVDYNDDVIMFTQRNSVEQRARYKVVGGSLYILSHKGERLKFRRAGQ